MKRRLERIRRAYSVLAEHKFTTIAGTLVFFLITSLVPFLFWLTLLFGSRLVGVEILDLELFGWAKDFLLLLRENAADASRGAGVFFLATTLWSSTGFFYHLRRSGEILYGSPRPKHGWRLRLSALALTFLLFIFFACAGALLFAGALSLRFLSPWIAYPAVYALLLIMGFFAAWILNAYACPYRISPADTALGSFFTALLWLVASAAFTIYLRFSGAEKLYGALALAIVFLLWLYWLMICFTAGAVYNHVRSENKRMDHKIF